MLFLYKILLLLCRINIIYMLNSPSHTWIGAAPISRLCYYLYLIFLYSVNVISLDKILLWFVGLHNIYVKPIYHAHRSAQRRLPDGVNIYTYVFEIAWTSFLNKILLLLCSINIIYMLSCPSRIWVGAAPTSRWC